MKIKLGGVRRVYITGEYIRLDALLKLSSVVSTGGEAKLLIQSGKVYFSGEQCFMRGKKIRPGETVRYGKDTIVVMQKNRE